MCTLKEKDILKQPKRWNGKAPDSTKTEFIIAFISMTRSASSVSSFIVDDHIQNSCECWFGGSAICAIVYAGRANVTDTMTGLQEMQDTRVMATSDHNMTSSENSEISSKPTLKKQTVWVADLIQADKGMEKVNWKVKQSMTKCVVCAC